ncbi:P-loop containing nucleoside triphosphate hydrolase protein [Mycena maculata]|uniref:P-loop containing nucleoside triphosphate hydrolase protein n=1 Tax=Mycena maculata TaxID=230809 RepID=A0AAD7I3K7_9AGAR|nr:P-loop containing nucleoside triphosphate hydrolase protein [Mycena maculata]
MAAKSSRKTVPLKSKLKKDPGIPRLPNIKVRNAEKLKTRAPQPPPRLDPDAVMASEPSLFTLANMPDKPSTSEKTKEQMRRHYLRTLHKVIDQSDIVILVLDARDPEGCRSRLVEEEVRRRESEGKKLVFVLNKVDLIPRANAQQWLKHLRHSTPTLPFRSPSSAQHQRTNISSSTAPALIKLLKGYKPSAGSVTVGVVGYPNVGKSSLINCLKRSKVCAVAAQPGHTKDLQSVQLERGMRIVDSPGVVFDDEDEKAGNILLRNVVKVEDVNDPIAVVEEILARTAPATIQKLYNLPEFKSTIEFLTMAALSSGRLLKGGTPDLTATARHILTDWNHQKIPYFSEPPAVHPSLIPSTVGSGATATIAPGAEQVGQAQILSSFSAPFSLPGLFNDADAGAFGTDTGDVAMDADEDGDVFVDAMDEDEFAMQADEPTAVPVPQNPRKRARSSSPSPFLFQSEDLPVQQVNEKYAHRQPKRMRKANATTAEVQEHNPLGRAVLKKEAKRARKAARSAARLSRPVGGMEVDDEVRSKPAPARLRAHSLKGLASYCAKQKLYPTLNFLINPLRCQL